MSAPDALEILKVARARLDDPKNWGQGPRNKRADPTTCCLAEAIELSPAGKAREQACTAVIRAAKLEISRSLTNWNDAPERKHSEVIKVLDIAIERAAASARDATPLSADAAASPSGGTEL